MKQFGEEIMQKYFSFELFLHYFKSITNSEKKKGYRTNFYAFHQKLYNAIQKKQYKPGRYSCFFVKDPKPREIFAPNQIFLFLIF